MPRFPKNSYRRGRLIRLSATLLTTLAFLGCANEEVPPDPDAELRRERGRDGARSSGAERGTGELVDDAHGARASATRCRSSAETARGCGASGTRGTTGARTRRARSSRFGASRPARKSRGRFASRASGFRRRFLEKRPRLARSRAKAVTARPRT